MLKKIYDFNATGMRAMPQDLNTRRDPAPPHLRLLHAVPKVFSRLQPLPQIRDAPLRLQRRSLSLANGRIEVSRLCRRLGSLSRCVPAHRVHTMLEFCDFRREAPLLRCLAVQVRAQLLLRSCRCCVCASASGRIAGSVSCSLRQSP
jgi:hypothetical protein